MNPHEDVEAVRSWGDCHVSRLSVCLGQVTVIEASALCLQNLDQWASPGEKCRRRLFPSHLNQKPLILAHCMM